MALEVFVQPGVGSSDALLDWLEYKEVAFVVRDCVRDGEALAEAMALGGGTLPVARRGDRVTVGFDPEALGSLIRAGSQVGAGLRVDSGPDGKPVIVGVEPGSKADRAGLRPGDVIAEVGGYTNFGLPDLERVLSSSATRSIRLTVRREDGMIQARLAA
ncbi:MAG: PDZ domain-containing protein [Candidatus Dormibacteraeota bacterium]|nr:PDZ domain-containing protein [Candidatus Dormibacteraeota bacterium]